MDMCRVSSMTTAMRKAGWLKLHGSEAGMCSMSIADLPEALLHDIFSRLDVPAICNAAQTCSTFLKVAGM